MSKAIESAKAKSAKPLERKRAEVGPLKTGCDIFVEASNAKALRLFLLILAARAWKSTSR